MKELEGMIDLHIHAAVDAGTHYRQGADTLRRAAEAGMRAILLKSHYTSTVSQAEELSRGAGGLQAFGGLACNLQAGGLDPARVEQALRAGAREIWMPTVSAGHWLAAKNPPETGLWAWDEAHQILPAVQEILRLIAQSEAILGTGHFSIPEIQALVQAARSAGVTRILVTHPESYLVAMPLEVERELRGPDLFFERCWLSTLMKAPHTVPLERVAHFIRETGVESTVLATDLGQSATPLPTEGLRAFVLGLKSLGFSDEEIDRMARRNPARLLNLSD